MTPEELAERRRTALRELGEAEARVLGLAEAGAAGAGELLEQIRSGRERLLGTAPPIKVDVVLSAGATPEERRQAVIAAVTKEIGEPLA